MKTKKILSCILAIMMLLSMATTSFAADINTDGGSQNVTVTYGMSEGFTVTIPADFTIGNSGKATANISASDVMIAHDNNLIVTIHGDDYINSWELIDKDESSNQLTYTIGSTEGGRNIIDGSIVLSVSAGEAYDSEVVETLYFTVVDELTKSGTYTDTLTFMVEVDDSYIEFSVDGVSYLTYEGNDWSSWVDGENFDTDCYVISEEDEAYGIPYIKAKNGKHVVLNDWAVTGWDIIEDGQEYVTAETIIFLVEGDDMRVLPGTTWRELANRYNGYYMFDDKGMYIDLGDEEHGHDYRYIDDSEGYYCKPDDVIIANHEYGWGGHREG